MIHWRRDGASPETITLLKQLGLKIWSAVGYDRMIGAYVIPDRAVIKPIVDALDCNEVYDVCLVDWSIEELRRRGFYPKLSPITPSVWDCTIHEWDAELCQFVFLCGTSGPNPNEALARALALVLPAPEGKSKDGMDERPRL